MFMVPFPVQESRLLNTAFKVLAFTFILHLTLNSKLNFAVKYSSVPKIQNLRSIG